MKNYQGSCHCQKIKFTINTIIDKVVACNCSICSKKGILHHQVPPDRFKLIQGEEYLSLYQFDSKEAQHYFCKVCGMHPFNHPRSAPTMYSINVRCLDNFYLENSTYKTISFDGQHWEKSVKKLRSQLS